MCFRGLTKDKRISEVEGCSIFERTNLRCCIVSVNHPRGTWGATHSPTPLTQRRETSSKPPVDKWPEGTTTDQVCGTGPKANPFPSTTVSMSEGLKIGGRGSIEGEEGGSHPRLLFSPRHPNNGAQMWRVLERCFLWDGQETRNQDEAGRVLLWPFINNVTGWAAEEEKPLLVKSSWK